MGQVVLYFCIVFPITWLLCAYGNYRFFRWDSINIRKSNRIRLGEPLWTRREAFECACVCLMLGPVAMPFVIYGICCELLPIAKFKEALKAWLDEDLGR